MMSAFESIPNSLWVDELLLMHAFPAAPHAAEKRREEKKILNWKTCVCYTRKENCFIFADMSSMFIYICRYATRILLGKWCKGSVLNSRATRVCGYKFDEGWNRTHMCYGLVGFCLYDFIEINCVWYLFRYWNRASSTSQHEKVVIKIETHVTLKLLVELLVFKCAITPITKDDLTIRFYIFNLCHNFLRNVLSIHVQDRLQRHHILYKCSPLLLILYTWSQRDICYVKQLHFILLHIVSNIRIRILVINMPIY